MKKFDGKVQMLDAGMVLFETKSDFGDTLGQVKAEMEVYGKVLKPADLSEAELPESTGECDLFLDWSTIGVFAIFPAIWKAPTVVSLILTVMRLHSRKATAARCSGEW